MAAYEWVFDQTSFSSSPKGRALSCHPSRGAEGPPFHEDAVVALIPLMCIRFGYEEIAQPG